MYMIKITEDKVEKLADKVGKALRYMGEAMSCIDKMQNGSEYDEMGERNYGGRYGNRYGMRGGYRDESEWEDMGERRGVPGSGRGYRY